MTVYKALQTAWLLINVHVPVVRAFNVEVLNYIICVYYVYSLVVMKFCYNTKTEKMISRLVTTEKEVDGRGDETERKDVINT